MAWWLLACPERPTTSRSQQHDDTLLLVPDCQGVLLSLAGQRARHSKRRNRKALHAP